MFAIAGALGSLIWQRRMYVARLRSLGSKRPVLRHWLLWEGAILLGVGCSTGALFGVYGQLLMSHALASVTGFPMSFNVEALVALWTFALVSAGAAVVVSLAGYLMARVQTPSSPFVYLATPPGHRPALPAPAIRNRPCYSAGADVDAAFGRARDSPVEETSRPHP